MKNPPRPGRAHVNRAARRLAERQGHLCAFCLLPFGTVVRRSGQSVIQRAVTDHLVPWALTRNDDDSNLVAACEVCNQIKTSRVFDSIVDIQRYVNKRRLDKGITVEFIPMVAITSDAAAWAREFSRHLTQ